MKKIVDLLVCIFLISVISCKNYYVGVAKVYYIDAKEGADDGDGLSPKTAWKSLERANTATFSPGDKILFKAGDEWMGQLHPKGSGSTEKPILISSYGNGKKPVIAGNGVDNGTIYLYNQEFWTINNLEVTNYNLMEQGGQSLEKWETGNTENYAEPILPAQLKNSNHPKCGIYILGEDFGEIAGIKLISLEVHGVNGYINQKDETSKDNGGILFKIIGSKKRTYFNGVIIDSVSVHDVDRTGLIICSSSWDKRTLKTNTDWTPSLNIKISNTIFSNTGANALIVRVAKKPIIENNLFDHCAIKASGNAAFSFNSDSAIWQFNECRFTKANKEDRDAGGIDADYKTKKTILQYNFVHDNDYGMLITGGPNNFNDSTIVRYNIFENDGKYAHPSHGKCVIRVSGSATNTYIYNNVIYLGKNQANTKIVSHEVWKTSPYHTVYQNNIFYNLSEGAFYDFEESKENIFNSNLYFGKKAINQQTDPKGLSADPKFTDPGSRNSKGYQLKKNSPGIGSGQIIKNNGGRDYFGTPLKPGSLPNIGIYELPN